MQNRELLDRLSREQLMELLDIYNKDFFALDGVWFQSIEQKDGMGPAMEHDIRAWKRFAPIEARRIKKFLGLEERPGLEGLEKALHLRPLAGYDTMETVRESENTLVCRVLTCRVQDARTRKGIPLHPCLSVGRVEFAEFGKAIDDRIEFEPVSCYPEVNDDSCACSWRYILKK